VLLCATGARRVDIRMTLGCDDGFILKKAVPPTKVWCNPALARLCTDLAHSPHG
jgi:hypothetical protein